MVDEIVIDPVIGVEGVKQGRRECGGERVLHGESRKIEVYARHAAEESVAQIFTFA
jgi:hypothetical protein